MQIVVETEQNPANCIKIFTTNNGIWDKKKQKKICGLFFCWSYDQQLDRPHSGGNTEEFEGCEKNVCSTKFGENFGSLKNIKFS